MKRIKEVEKGHESRVTTLIQDHASSIADLKAAKADAERRASHMEGLYRAASVEREVRCIK